MVVDSPQVSSDELHWWCSAALVMYRPLQPGDDVSATGALDHQMLIGLGRLLTECAGVVGCLVEPMASGFGR